MKRLFSVAMLLTLLALPLTCLAQAQRSQEFKDKYKLKEAVVLSTRRHICLLYTSDAADDLIGVDLGGARNDKKETLIERRQIRSS